ncbi:heavy metal transporter [Candidatus Formimonas warabiya]|uniref:Heavy metal transporter n=2 Tax=Formimonas warabiya TaxID=1761012 RepID=A0A3G1L076_FORW1|nr:heavy metal transporter [Candidatus Formimonas warabiya]
MEQKLVHTFFYIEGMSCTGCEMRIEKAVKMVEGVIEAAASFSKAMLDVTYDANRTGVKNIITAIEKLDYRVVKEPGMEKADDIFGSPHRPEKTNINQLLGIGIILLALYIVIKNTVGFNFIPQVNQSMGYGILFVVGLLTSLHCIAMCGGINLSQCVSGKFIGERSKLAKFKPSFLYNAGRVLSYTLIGGAVGALGSVVSFSGSSKGIVAIISGAFMIVMGLNMLNVFPWLKRFQPRMPKIFGNRIYGSVEKYGPFYVGLLNGFMPCGPLQAMQLYALGTGSLGAGALSMFYFSLGTVPLAFGLGAVSSFLSSRFTRRMLKVSMILVVVLGVLMVNRGLNLSGLSVSLASSGTGNIAQITGDVQVVTTKMESGQYTPIIVQKGIPVKWTIKADSSDLNGCNNPLTIPEFNIEKKLVPGDNIIEFTPEKEGDIVYTCWMGMISSKITVVPDVTQVSEKDLPSADPYSAGGSGGGCCAAGSKATKFAGGNIPTDEIAVGEIKDGVQYVTMNVNDYGYAPAVLVVQKGVKTRWTINGEQLNNCNASIQIPEYNSQVDLHEGENMVEFVPEQDFSFSCWMGMLNGYVKTVDDINKVNLEEVKQQVAAFQPAGGSGGCCGGGGSF